MDSSIPDPTHTNLDFVSFLQKCIPGADKIFDFISLPTFLSLRLISQDMKDTVDSSYRFYRHLKSHVIWMRSPEELKSMNEKVQQLLADDEYSLIHSIQFGVELNESTSHNYLEFLSNKDFVQKITHLKITKSICYNFSLQDDQLHPTIDSSWLSEFQDYLIQSQLKLSLHSLEIDELSFNDNQKFHKFFLNLANARKNSPNPDKLHPLSIKIVSAKAPNEFASFLSSSGQKGVFLNASQSKERLESLQNSNFRVSLTLRELAETSTQLSTSPSNVHFLSSVENIVDLQSFPSTQQMETLPRVPLENCKFENISGLILNLPPVLASREKPKLSSFYEFLYFVKGAWPNLGKRVTQLTIQSSGTSDSTTYSYRKENELLPIIKLHAEGMRRSFPNLKRIQIWGSFTQVEWNEWWVALRKLRNLWSLSIKPQGTLLQDEVFLPPPDQSGSPRTPSFVHLPPLDCLHLYASTNLSADSVPFTDSVYKEVFSRMKIRSFQFVGRRQTKVSYEGLSALAEGTFGRTIEMLLFDVQFDGNFPDIQVAKTKLNILCQKNISKRKANGIDPEQ